jgi:hypothetical protein
MDEIYNFVYKGILTDESLDKVGRKKRKLLGREEIDSIRKLLSYEMLDRDHIVNAEKMSIIYIALHTFENMVREFVKNAMIEEYHEEWWNKVSEKIRIKATTRMEDDAKFRWHGKRGGTEIEYCDFGDLSSIIVQNWTVFKEIIVDEDWVKSLLSVLERSRNIIMHGGILANQDIERIGINIRDWVRQVG